MESEKFDLIFNGQILPKQEVAVVKANLAELFKVSSKQVDALFSGKAVVLKRNLDLAAANRYRVAIKKAGARVDLVKAGSTVISNAPTSQPAAAVNKPVNETVGSQSPEVARGKQESGANWQLASIGANLSEPNKNAVIAPVIAPDFEVLIAGSDLLEEGERSEFTPLEIDTSGISIRETEGNLIDEGEWMADLPVIVADLDVEILPVGATLVTEGERIQKTVKKIADLNLEVAPVGARLEPEKPAAAKAPNVDHIELSDF